MFSFSYLSNILVIDQIFFSFISVPNDEFHLSVAVPIVLISLAYSNVSDNTRHNLFHIGYVFAIHFYITTTSSKTNFAIFARFCPEVPQPQCNYNYRCNPCTHAVTGIMKTEGFFSTSLYPIACGLVPLHTLPSYQGKHRCIFFSGWVGNIARAEKPWPVLFGIGRFYHPRNDWCIFHVLIRQFHHLLCIINCSCILPATDYFVQLPVYCLVIWGYLFHFETFNVL